MGKSQSKDVKNSGDPQVNIINTLESHEELHYDHELKLWILLAINVLQITWTILKYFQKRVQKKAFNQGVKSMDALNKV